jgi:hypothetical protein
MRIKRNLNKAIEVFKNYLGNIRIELEEVLKIYITYYKALYNKK